MRYWVRSAPDAQGKRHSLGTYDTPEEAEKIDRGAAHLLATGTVKQVGRTSLGDFGLRVLDLRELDGVRGVAGERRRFRRHVAPTAFARMAIERIRPVDVSTFLRAVSASQAADRREARTISRQTTQRVLSLVSTIFAEAVSQGLIDANPCIGLRVRTKGVAETTREKWTCLTPEEQSMLRQTSAIPLHYRLMIRFAIGTGLRQGEQWSLELQDLIVRGENPHVHVRLGAKGLPPKSGKARRVPLFGDALEAAREWLALLPRWAPSNPERLVFPTASGARRQVGKLVRHDTFRALLRAAGILRPVRWHDLRHTCASSLIAGWWGHRWTLDEVRALLGHSSVTVTERYAHLGETALRAAARATSAGYPVVTVPPEALPVFAGFPNDIKAAGAGGLEPTTCGFGRPGESLRYQAPGAETGDGNPSVTSERIRGIRDSGDIEAALALALSLLSSLRK